MLIYHVLMEKVLQELDFHQFQILKLVYFAHLL